MKIILSLLTTAMALGCVAPQGAWAHSQDNHHQGTRNPTASPQHSTDGPRVEHHRSDGDAYWHRRFFREPYFWYAGCYEFGPDCTYVLVSPEQQALAQERIETYLAAVHRGRRPAPTGRYLAVESLGLTRGDRFVMVYDIVSARFLVPGAYRVSSLPPIGSPVHLASVRAELVG